MSELDDTLRDLVLANRILAHEGVVDAYGHVSVRNPNDPGRYFISVSRSPELVTHEDIVECSLDGRPVRSESRPLYLERFIHGAIYEARPEVMGVVHSHALEVLPFSISPTPLRPVLHSAGPLGHRIPVWDIADRFGDTTLLVVNMAHGRDLAERLGFDRVVLMRGHGFAAAGRSVREVVRLAVNMPRNARVLLDAIRLGGPVKGLSPGEIDRRLEMRPDGAEFFRAWEYWAKRAGCAELLGDAPRSVAVSKPAPKAPPPKKKAAKKGRR
ncbi:MAG TPA: class II aldolase/adducin family protein [Stellaceae bacterium]|nr:class II aldolase/adducin family protein [Stellaceae bacterium]